MGSFWIQAIQLVGYNARSRPSFALHIKPRIWAVAVIIVFVLCTVGGMSAQIANQHGKHVAANSCMPWHDQSCGRGDRLIKGFASSADE
jgi:hypothetical protein